MIRFKFENPTQNVRTTFDAQEVNTLADIDLNDRKQLIDKICDAEAMIADVRFIGPQLMTVENYLVWLIKGNATRSQWKGIYYDPATRINIAVKQIN